MREDARMTSWLSSVAANDRVVTYTMARGEIPFGLERLAQGRRRVDLEEKAQKLFGVLPCEPRDSDFQRVESLADDCALTQVPLAT